MPTEKNDLHRGTLDMLILKIVAAGPLHGYAIAQRLQQISKDYFKCRRVRFTPRFIGSKSANGSTPNGKTPAQAGKRSFTL